MASGVQIADEVCDVVKAIQMGGNHKYVIFCLNKKMDQIVVEKCAKKDAPYDEFIADMKAASDENECRWAIVDVDYTTRSGMPKTKLVFVLWNPDSAKIKQKMVTASSSADLKKKIGNAVGVSIQATDFDEIEIEFMRRKIAEVDKA